jgi:ACT domain-containing protein
MKAVITVTGKDNVGIIAKVSALCSEYGANISDISQTVLSDYFAMIMLVDIKALKIEFGAFADELKQLGTDNSLDIHTMHEDIFNSMHRI